jgi:hypothetical protein
MLVEVGGEESLHNFNQHFLVDRFQPFFLEGNSKRGIDLGFLIRKDLDWRPECLSNRETPVEVHTWKGKIISRFSRDVAELRLHEGCQLKIILLLTHLKSKISTLEDVGGKDVRTAEAIALAGIYEKLRKDLPDVPVVVGGDLNTDISSLELEVLRRTDLQDYHDIAKTSPEDRVSLVHFDFFGRPRHSVLDYLLVSPHLQDRVVKSKSYTYRYKGFYDVAEELPRLLKERYQMPSDHYPLVLTLRI